MSGDFGDPLHGGEPIHDRSRIGGGDQKVEVSDRFHSPAQAPGRFDTLDLRQVLQAGKNPVGDFSRLPPKMPGCISLAVLDPGEDLFLGLFAEALELGDLSFVTRLGQRLDRIDV